jgi:hypothetical protein
MTGLAKLMRMLFTLAISAACCDSATAQPSITDFEAQYFISTSLNSFILGKPSAAPTWGGRRCPNGLTPAAISIGIEADTLPWAGDALSDLTFNKIRLLGFWPFRCQLVSNLLLNYKNYLNLVDQNRAGEIDFIEFEFAGLSHEKCIEYSKYVQNFVGRNLMFAAIDEVAKNYDWHKKRQDATYYANNSKQIFDFMSLMEQQGISLSIQCGSGEIHVARYDLTKVAKQIKLLILH